MSTLTFRGEEETKKQGHAFVTRLMPYLEQHFRSVVGAGGSIRVDHNVSREDITSTFDEGYCRYRPGGPSELTITTRGPE
jgi:hypothetical protein